MNFNGYVQNMFRGVPLSFQVFVVMHAGLMAAKLGERFWNSKERPKHIAICLEALISYF